MPVDSVNNLSVGEVDASSFSMYIGQLRNDTVLPGSPPAAATAGPPAVVGGTVLVGTAVVEPPGTEEGLLSLPDTAAAIPATTAAATAAPAPMRTLRRVVGLRPAARGLPSLSSCARSVLPSNAACTSSTSVFVAPAKAG
ncbi:unannotated protein [freshwater metagenome]|uniref:Unannotated protein n=1 Tax=freshwater metagenome TaxID=449393 RepID=A0A6J7EAH2_9ZZZZ